MSKVLQNAPKEYSAILSTFIKLPFVFKTFVLSIFEWLLKTGFTVFNLLQNCFNIHVGDVINNKVAISVCLLDHLLTICTVYVGYDCFKKNVGPTRVANWRIMSRLQKSYFHFSANVVQQLEKQNKLMCINDDVCLRSIYM